MFIESNKGIVYTFIKHQNVVYGFNLAGPRGPAQIKKLLVNPPKYTDTSSWDNAVEEVLRGCWQWRSSIISDNNNKGCGYSDAAKRIWRDPGTVKQSPFNISANFMINNRINDFFNRFFD
jgi:hypothetical protein